MAVVLAFSTILRFVAIVGAAVGAGVVGAAVGAAVVGAAVGAAVVGAAVGAGVVGAGTGDGAAVVSSPPPHPRRMRQIDAETTTSGNFIMPCSARRLVDGKLQAQR